MKKLVKLATSLVLIGSMVLSMTGCAITDVKNKGNEIMDNVFALKASKVTKCFNEDDDDYDAQVEMFEDLSDDFENELEIGFEDVKANKTSININNDDATIEYVFPIEDEEYEFTLELTKDGDDWVIADNEEFMVSVWNLYFEVTMDAGSKSQKQLVEDLMDEVGVSKVGKLGQAFYDTGIEIYG
ncbi:MAG: hypothetical protein MJ166_09695 [Clostridia bacterium]|nr:hypothetical protein [Clostridia bacterium]